MPEVVLAGQRGAVYRGQAVAIDSRERSAWESAAGFEPAVTSVDLPSDTELDRAEPKP